MSRSKKNHKLKWGCFMHWVSYRSNKKDKIIANRKMRRNNKIIIKLGKEPFNKLKEVCDIWNFNSDGSAYYRSYNLQNRYKGYHEDPYGYHGIYSFSPWEEDDIRKINQK